MIQGMPNSPRGAPETVSLLAHDVRWRLAEHLSRSDHTVGELVEAVDERQNLVELCLADGTHINFGHSGWSMPDSGACRVDLQH